MKILHINRSDSSGGAAQAAMRLHKALKGNGITSLFLANTKNTNRTDVYQYPNNKLLYRVGNKLNYLAAKKIEKLNPVEVFKSTFAPFNLKQTIKDLAPDIIHLHWINGFLDLKDLSGLGIPIVWSLHDMWPITGGCHYNLECNRFTMHCGKCPILRSNQEYDLSYKYRDQKEKVYSNLNLSFIGLSSWIANEARASSVTRGKQVVNLPNCLDVDIFKPLPDTAAIKARFNIPADKKALLFGANELKYARKGAAFIKELVDTGFLKRHNCVALLVGSPDNSIFEASDDVIVIGHINGESKIAEVYNAADILVFPSMQENLSNMIMEALACGTPVVGFSIGGNGDMIIDGENGYLVGLPNTQNLIHGLEQALLRNWDRDAISYATSSRFSYNAVAPTYTAYYESLLRG